MLTQKINSHCIEPCKLSDLELHAKDLDLDHATAIYKKYNCLVVRGLNKAYASEVYRDIMDIVDVGISQLPQASKNNLGWSTPNGILWLPAPAGFDREQQVMTVPLKYSNSGSFLASAMNPIALDITCRILGDDIELCDDGQSLCKEPCGGHPKLLHQDGAYFAHRHEGPVAVLSYAQDTSSDMGPLRVIPGSNHWGLLPHEDTFSHLGLNETDWPWESTLEIEGEAGDAIFFGINCIHGSKPNVSNKRRGVFINRYRHIDDYQIMSATTTMEMNESSAKRVREKSDDHFMVRGYRRN